MNKGLAKNYLDGYKAFMRVDRRNGRFHVVANPLKKNTTPYREWQRGWDAAYFKYLEKQHGLGTAS
jgi:hypothetical protein